jgi:hypothetical protein
MHHTSVCCPSVLPTPLRQLRRMKVTHGLGDFESKELTGRPAIVDSLLLMLFTLLILSTSRCFAVLSRRSEKPHSDFSGCLSLIASYFPAVLNTIAGKESEGTDGQRLLHLGEKHGRCHPPPSDGHDVNVLSICLSVLYLFFYHVTRKGSEHKRKQI